LIGADLTNVRGYEANLTNADLSQANLTNGNLGGANLTGANFREANLANASFAVDRCSATEGCVVYATLTDADFTAAKVRGANFSRDPRTYSGGNGFTAAQLYATASYQAHDLSGIGLGGSDFAGENFAGQNLTKANFYAATLTAADFAGAEVGGASFQKALLEWIFNGVYLFGSGITVAQLYSTASYQAQDLRGTDFSYNDLRPRSRRPSMWPVPGPGRRHVCKFACGS
jgi:uncharacterized protein YjbI with pentapeptide repeats